MEETKPDIVGFVMRQTGYTEEEALKKLEEFDNDKEKVVDDYLNIGVKVNNMKSVNQEIYKEIRTLMDDTIRGYEERKRNNDKKNK